jgi:beta-glucosidase
MDRAATGGQNAHRLSIEWSRVQPARDRWDESALDYYRQMIKGMVDRGITPMVTLHHFTHPLWISEIGGWESSETPKHLYEYARRVVAALKDYVALWCTINEPNVIAAVGYLDGAMPPGVSDIGRAFVTMENLARAHVAAYQAVHEVQPSAKAGPALAYRGMHAAGPWSFVDRLVARAHSHLFNEFFPQTIRDGMMRFLTKTVPFKQARGTQDFLGVNYYTEDVVAFNFNINEAFGHHYFPSDAEISPHGLIANRPEGFLHALQWAAGFGVPVIVTENGVEDGADQLRPRYLAQHIHRLWRAVDAGVPVQGYFHWSLVDNFEWERGWTQRFGLWELDTQSQLRRKRRSAEFYERICTTNSLSAETVSTYAPGVLDEVFHGSKL